MAEERLPHGVMTVSEHTVHHLRTMAYLVQHAEELGIAANALGFEVRENGSGNVITLTFTAPAGDFRRLFDELDDRRRR